MTLACLSLQDDATVKCWGYNVYGKLGLGNDVRWGDDANGPCPPNTTTASLFPTPRVLTHCPCSSTRGDDANGPCPLSSSTAFLVSAQRAPTHCPCSPTPLCPYSIAHRRASLPTELHHRVLLYRPRVSSLIAPALRNNRGQLGLGDTSTPNRGQFGLGDTSTPRCSCLPNVPSLLLLRVQRWGRTSRRSTWGLGGRP